MSHVPPDMNLEPEIAAFVQHSYDIGDTSTGLSIEEQRANYSYYCTHFTPPHPPNITSDDRSIETPEGSVPVRWYRHKESDSSACVVFYHGGGFVVGGLDSHDFLCARLCSDTGNTVIAVDYRRAPENVFPAAFDDCFNVLQALRSSAEQYDINAAKIVLCGDSAGGNLVAAVALAERDRGGASTCGQVMIYPTLAADTQLPAYEQCSNAPMLTTQDMEFYLGAYLGEAGVPSPYSAPLLADNLRGLPPALLLPVEYDPLRDDAIAYHEKLLAADVNSILHMGKGLVHGCMRAVDTSPGVQAVYQRMVGFIADVIE